MKDKHNKTLNKEENIITDENNPFVEENADEPELIENNETNDTQSEITQLQTDNDNLKNQYVRLAADFDNYRKRQAQERECSY